LPRYVFQADIEASLPPQTLVQLTDDDGDGVPDAAVIGAIIEDAEAEAEGFVIGQYSKLPDGISSDRLFKLSVKEIVIAFLFRRHPEYVRTYGEHDRSDSMYKRAIERLNRIQNAEQQLPDVVQEDGFRPKNVGGIVYDSGRRMFIDNADGTSNAGDF